MIKMLTTVPIPIWLQRSRQLSSYLPCVGEWSEDWTKLAWPHMSATLNGESFERDTRAPHQGDGINALPYWSRKASVSVPYWEASCIQKSGPCDGYEYKGDGRSMTGISTSELYAPSKVSADDKAFCKRFALLKAQAALRNADASIPMMLKERAATVAMMKSYAGRSLDLIRRRQLADVKRWKSFAKRPREQKKFLAQQIANEHLMFVFGLLPLIGELEGLAEHVTRDEHKFIKGRGRHTKKLEESSAQEHPYGHHTVTKIQDIYSVRCNLRADISMKVLAQAQQLGFNPLYTLYDFTPLSFVTGWFSNFNFWLKSLDPLYGSTFRTGSYSTRVQTVITKETHPWSTDRLTPKGNGSSFGMKVHDVREPINSMPPTGAPEFYNNFSFFSVAASASLFVQRKVKLTQKAIGMKPFRYRSKKPAYLPPITYKKV